MILLVKLESIMFCKLIVSFIFALSLGVRDIAGYKILGLFPYYGASHFVMFKSVMKGLAMKGHEVHVLSHFPLESHQDNYTDLSVLGSIPLDTNNLAFPSPDLFGVPGSMVLYRLLVNHENVMKTMAVQKLLESKQRYDLIITESFITDMVLGFVHKFKVPFIFLSSSALPPWTNSLVASPQNPAFIPHPTSHSPPNMTFVQRIRNTFKLVEELIAWYWFLVPASQRIMDKYFGDDMPPLLEIAKNVSLVLANTHPSIFGGRPSASNVIEIGGVHIQPAKKLPHDIEKFIEDAEHGVIYFCMGSLLRGANLPEKKRNAFLDAFSKLDERVLWKFEDESFVTSENILIKGWMPQRDILAHPKVKLFISHGGLLGMLEAVGEGKPILGIPVFAEQSMNVRSLEAQGVAKYLDYHQIDSSILLEAIQELLKPECAKNAEQLSKVFHDRPTSPMDTAVYWIEYVIRNRGAKHLRSTAVDLPYYQYLSLDVVAFFLFCALLILISIYYVVKIIIFGKTTPKSLEKKSKQN